MLLCVLVQAAVWMLLRAVRRGRYRAVEKWGIALLLAAGLWVKFSAISLIPVLLVGAWWLGRDAGPQGSSASVLESTRGLVIAALPVAVGLAGALPWLIRQYLVYGEPSGTSVFEPIATPLTEKVPYALLCLSYSFWVAFGRLNEIGWPEHPLFWFAWDATCILGCLIVLRRSWRDWDLVTRRCVSLLIVGAFVQFAMVLGFGVHHLQCQGRYLFPMLPAFALAAAAGIRIWLPDRLRPFAPLLWCAGLQVLAAIYASQAVA
jgi:hypothetical protein